MWTAGSGGGEIGAVGAPEVIVLLLTLLFLGPPAWMVAKAGYRRGMTHGTRPDSRGLVVLGFIFLFGFSVLYWVARFLGARKHDPTQRATPTEAARPAPHRPDWYGDPFRRYQQRYFDGQIWTDRVRTQGRESQENLQPVDSRPRANWYKDPAGRYELRYFDGARWTDHVTTDGVQSIDSLGGVSGT